MGTGAPIRRPELTELETFLATARSGSVVRAGEQLRISKTAAAKRLASLEALVGRRLLDRSPRGVTLTEAGRRLVPKVEQLLAQADETFEHVGLLRRGEDRPRVRGLQAVVGDRTPSTEQVLVDTELLFAEVFHRVDQGILIARTEDRVVVEVNDACCRILEHHREEILGSSAETWDLVSPGDTPAFRRQFEESDAIAELEIDVMVRPGVRKRLAVTARAITIHGQNLTVAALRELTRRERLQDRLMRFYSLVIQPASGVVRAATTHELYQRMCELAVKQSGFALAWVGELDEDTGLVTAAAASGATEYLAELRITVAASDPHGQGPTGTALRELRPATCNDIAADPAMEPWRERAVAHSFASSAAFPLVTHRGARAVLTVYAAETDFFTREHSDMLQDLALHASMTLGAQQREAERFRQALAGSGLTAFTMDRELRYTWVENPSLGYAPHQVFGRTDAEMMPPEAAAKVSALKRRVIDRGESVAEDVSIATDGGLRWFSITAQPIRDASGAIIGLAGQSTDITERKRAEAERARLATIVESAEDAIFGVNTEGVIETWNRGAERLFGFAAREVLGRSPAILRSPEFGDSRVTDALAGETSRGDGQMLRRDGRVVDVRISVSPIEVDGVIVGTSFIVQDITGQHEAQQARARALRDLEEAQRIAKIGSFTRDPDADAATWSPQLFEILERDPALGAPSAEQLMAYLHEDERELAKAIFSGRDMTAEHNVRMITGTGKERIMHLAVHPDPSRPGRFTGTIQDITEQQLQAKAAAHLAAIVASSQDAIISITLAGLITSWNDAAQGIYGYSESETLGRHISMLLPEGQADPTTEIMDQVSAGEATSFEATRRRKDGRRIDIATTISPFTDADGRPIGASAIVRDITERRQIEQARAWALRDLEEAQRIANIGSFTWDPATDSATWSRQLFAIFERDPALGTPGAQGVLSYLHEDERERWLRSVAQREMQIDDDWRIVTGAGRERTVHMTAYPDRDRPGCFLGTCQDVTEQRRAQEELRRERDFNDATLDVAGAPIVVMDADWRLVRFNRQSELLSGCSEAEVLGRHYEFLVPPEERVRVHTNIEAAQAGQVVTQENHWFTRDGGRRLIRWSNQVLRDEAGTFTHLIAVGIDITEQRQAELALKAAEERFRRAFDEAPIGIALLSPDGVLREVNAALGVICGRELSELAGTGLEALVVPADVENLERALAALVAGRQVITELRITPALGSVLQVTMHGTLLRGHGQSPQLLCQFQDVTERKRFETQLQFMADHDPLTGLWNRRRFEAELDRHVEAVTRYGPDGAVLILDVDDFKAVNDTLGHNIGDQLIVSIAGVLRGRLRDSDVLARLGGDEFAVLLPKADRAAAGRVADALVNAVATNTSLLSGEHKQIACSIGIAMLESADVSTERSMIEADLAMYDVKAEDGNGYAFYSTTEHLASRTKARLTWMRRMERALDEDGFELAAQPILDLRSDQVHQYELLLRMRGDDGDLIPPSAFLYIAERFGLIGRIDEWVVARAIALIAEHPDLQLEVNISGRSLGDQLLLTQIDRCLHEHSIDPTHLIFEVTETAAVANIAHAQSFAEHLRDHGCRFALDDFGAGFGSFYYLKHLPFDYVKIDGEFVQHAAATRVDQLMIEAVVGIAQGLGKETIAEFVVDGPTMQMVKDLDVDYAQGYHIGKPVPVSEFFPHSERT